MDTKTILFSAGLVVLASALGVGASLYFNLKQELEQTKSTLASTTAELQSSISSLEQERTLLTEALQTEQLKNDDFERQIEDIFDTVGDLDKLAKTDPELLQKYSKVYFLNEHYQPDGLKEINSDYVVPAGDDEFIHPKVWPPLEDLLRRAKRDDIELRIVSAYRSFDEQSQLKNQYTVVYGAGTANQFSADQGYSEHQLGTTVDFTTPELGENFGAFGGTEAYAWLTDNAHKYGFVLSYPEGNSFYVFEPWHWRFVGEKLAQDLHEDNAFFYDLNQREIDTYLIELFD